MWKVSLLSFSFVMFWDNIARTPLDLFISKQYIFSPSDPPFFFSVFYLIYLTYSSLLRSIILWNPFFFFRAFERLKILIQNWWTIKKRLTPIIFSGFYTFISKTSTQTNFLANFVFWNLLQTLTNIRYG